MKNHLKMTLLAGVILLALLSVSNASAISQYYTYTPASSGYTDISETVSYAEDIAGENRGFSLRHSSTVPRTSMIRGCDYYDWTSDYRKCRRTAYYNGYTEDSYGYSDSYNNYRANYDQDKAVQLAFKTFQQDSQAQIRFESEKQRLKYQRRYGGYGYGYSSYGGYGRMRWGW